ncbi:hypothetical protein BCR26_12815 [Enterococcus rivorum]|uniref:DUF2798 domain-containing protein n=1 Tax=Enterococcus rivorum TaxID=762845 RepID=A0A1E5KXU2_9ENTE|nr:hypothetical protein BCR26_12815 [Enterococcus rivorum]
MVWLFYVCFWFNNKGWFSGNIFQIYLTVFAKSIIMALTLQWLVLEPLARKILAMYQNNQLNVD